MTHKVDCMLIDRRFSAVDLWIRISETLACDRNSNLTYGILLRLSRVSCPLVVLLFMHIVVK